MEHLDKTDILILRILQKNSRLTTREIANKVNLSTTPVFERIKRMEEAGYIKRYVALLDAEKLNRGFLVYCCVKLRQLTRETAMDFMNMVKNIPEVTECYNISGEYDYLLKVYARDMKAYQEFILNELGTIESLGSLTSMFVMAEVKHENALPF